MFTLKEPKFLKTVMFFLFTCVIFCSLEVIYFVQFFRVLATLCWYLNYAYISDVVLTHKLSLSM